MPAEGASLAAVHGHVHLAAPREPFPWRALFLYLASFIGGALGAFAAWSLHH